MNVKSDAKGRGAAELLRSSDLEMVEKRRRGVEALKAK